MSRHPIKVMGILNVTPDSFYLASRKQTEKEIALRTEEIFSQGGDIIDIGAFSTRPNHTFVTEDDELYRLRLAVNIVKNINSNAVISIDTYRASIAKVAIEEFGASIINDISEISDEKMVNTLAKKNVHYVLTSQKSNIDEMIVTFTSEIDRLRRCYIKDIIIDPGFGFGKTIDENFKVLSQLERLKIFNLPILVGLSRKSMIWETLGTSIDEALNGTIALNMAALMKGASILRVHDVKAAVETIKCFRNIL